MNKCILIVVMKCILLQEERIDNSGSSIEQNFLLELENFISLNDVVDDMISQIEGSVDTHVRR